MNHDVIVVGGSYSGMAATLQLVRARRSVLVIDAGQRRNRFASHSHGFLGQDGVPPGEIAANARRQLEAYPTLTWLEGRVEAVAGQTDEFTVTTADGESHLGRRILLATGVTDQLPAIDGLTVLGTLRLSKQTPVLMLTARGRVEDRVQGLTAGADDYLVKPFAFSELLARIQTILRRAGTIRPSPESTLLKLADLELDLLRRKATRAGQRLDLTPKEFNLLSLLMRREGEVLSRTELAAQVWDMNFDSETNVVEVAVRRLRTKLDQPFETSLLHTVRGMGYVLERR